MAQKIEDAFRFCPVCGTAGSAAGEIPFVCQSCGFHHFFSPATAVGALIADQDHRLLFIERARDPGKGKLGMPGGFVDIGESAEQAVTREVEEEVGLQITRLHFLTTYPNVYQYREIITQVLDLFFVCDVESFDDLEIERQEVRSFRFAKPSAEIYGQMAFESNRKAVQLFAEKYLS